VPTQAFNFAFKDPIKKLFPKGRTFTERFAVNVCAGGLAGMGSLMIVYPLDYARTRLAIDIGSETEKRAFTGLWDCLYKTVKGPSGVLGLYNGFGIAVVGSFPLRGAYFGVNDTLLAVNPYQQDPGLVGLASKFACAQTAALTAAFVSYPFDTVRNPQLCAFAPRSPLAQVRRRLQMQADRPRSEWIYTGTAHCFRRIVREEGPLALFKGAGANAIRAVGAALVLVMYGEIKAVI
jgi:solute carrier family 25 (adenine nucleotide translocator) protein 4/5/6/31